MLDFLKKLYFLLFNFLFSNLLYFSIFIFSNLLYLLTEVDQLILFKNILFYLKYLFY